MQSIIWDNTPVCQWSDNKKAKKPGSLILRLKIAPKLYLNLRTIMKMGLLSLSMVKSLVNKIDDNHCQFLMYQNNDESWNIISTNTMYSSIL